MKGQLKVTLRDNRMRSLRLMIPFIQQNFTFGGNMVARARKKTNQIRLFNILIGLDLQYL